MLIVSNISIIMAEYLIIYYIKQLIYKVLNGGRVNYKKAYLESQVRAKDRHKLLLHVAFLLRADDG